MRLNWTPIALRQLRDARAFMAADNPDAADALVTQIEERAQTLLIFPAAGRPDTTGRRRLALPPTPYSLIYRVAEARIVILAVWHGARQWPPSA